jgi:hypothetical protein
MKALTTLGTALLFLTLGTIVPAFAQDKQEEAKPEQKQEQEHAQPQKQQPQQQAKPPSQSKPAQPKQEAKQPSENKPAQAQQQAKQPSQNKPAQPQQQAKQPSQNKPAQPKQEAKQPSQSKPAQQQQAKQQPAQHTQEQQHAQQAAWQGHQSGNWQSDHRTWQQRGGYNGYRIPDNRYNGYFGSGHAFVIFSQPYMVVGGFPRFQYSGYWFSLVDPWPSSWANNWYETDNVYVVYADNGYYMYNQSYPGVGIAISVSL